VTSSLPEYAALAQWLAEDRDILGEIKKRLAETRTTSPLFDTDLMRRNLEEAYTAMWALRQAGRRPQEFDVEALSPPPPSVPEAAAGPAGVSDAAAPGAASPLGGDAAAPNDPAVPAGAAPLTADAPIATPSTPKSQAAAPAGSDAQS
jgi:hypothetical protein